MIPAIIALVCCALGAILAWHYPVASAAMILAFIASAAAVFLRPRIWLVVVPALIPLIGFASWTGWVTFEETDILVLGVAAGGYARMSLRGRVSGGVLGPVEIADRQDMRLSVVPIILVALFVLSSAVALYRGIVDAGGPEWGWFHGYYEALNSLRVTKSFLLAVLLLPLLLAAIQTSGQRAVQLLSMGLALGCAGVSTAILWERAAFPQLLNFSSDYRTTALFWEMHVGGAALDGFLVLTAPFAFRELLRASTPFRIALAGTLVAAVSYGLLTTFSRGVYLALPIAIALTGALLLGQKKRTSGLSIEIGDIAKFAVLAAAVTVMFYLVFRAGGYRTLIATLGAAAVSIPLASAARHATFRQWAFGIGVGALLGIVGAVISMAIPKGAYLVFAGAFGSCCWLAWQQHRRGSTGLVGAILAAFVWVLAAVAGVALFWGGESALTDSLVALSCLMVLLVWGARSARPLWPESTRARCVVVGSAVLIAGTVAIFSGGTYMSGRFASSENDLANRIAHWSAGIGLLKGPGDWLLGKGQGRFPANSFFAVPDSVFPGSSRWRVENGHPFLALSGPRYSSSFGDAFRVAQRVPASADMYSLSFAVRAQQDVQLNVEVCEKHLLYAEGCAAAAVGVKPSGMAWRTMTVSLDGRQLSGGPWYAPRLGFFSMAVESSGRLIEIRDIVLVGREGRNLIANGDFSAGMARWFFTSDRYHLPWHIKNLALCVLFDQGLIGLALFTMLLFVALWRLIAGRARGHPLAPFLAGALVGFVIVGLFDSLLDVPRVALLFYLLLLLSLALRENEPEVPAGSQ